MPMRVRNFAFGKGGEGGTEKPTTEDTEGKGLEAEAASQDGDDSFGRRGVVSGTGTCVGVGVDEVDRVSLLSGSAHGANIS